MRHRTHPCMAAAVHSIPHDKRDVISQQQVLTSTALFAADMLQHMATGLIGSLADNGHVCSAVLLLQCDHHMTIMHCFD